MRIKATDLAWAAGIIDGEGCLHVQRRFNREGKRHAPHYSLTLRVGMKSFCTIMKLHDLFGGNRCVGSNGVVCWTVATQQALSVLRLVRKYMLTKRQQVEFVLHNPAIWERNYTKLDKKTKRYRVPAATLSKREAIYRRLREMKGVQT